MKLTEEVFKMKKIIYEISPKSVMVKDVLTLLQKDSDLIEYLNFSDYKNAEDFILNATYDDFVQIENEIEEYLGNKNIIITSEMDEIERAAQDLNREDKVPISVAQIVVALEDAPITQLTKDVWEKLENTESNQIKKGEWNKVEEIAKKYNKTSPQKLKRALKGGEYNPPLILKFGDRYHLIAGNTRLSTAAAMGFYPKVIIGEYES